MTRRSRRELPTHMVIHRDLFKYNQITLFPCFIFIPKVGVSFFCVRLFFVIATHSSSLVSLIF